MISHKVNLHLITRTNSWKKHILLKMFINTRFVPSNFWSSTKFLKVAFSGWRWAVISLLKICMVMTEFSYGPLKRERNLTLTKWNWYFCHSWCFRNRDLWINLFRKEQRIALHLYWFASCHYQYSCQLWIRNSSYWYTSFKFDTAFITII